MVRVGIIGCGSIAKQRHAYEYHLRPDVEIAGFYDGDKSRSQALADSFGAKTYESMETMLSDSALDAVSVCVSNAFHAECTIKALSAGKHVLCEKPMAITLADCQAMLKAAEKNGKRLCVGHNQRLAPAHVYAKRILDAGDLGRVISFQSVFGHKGPEMWSADKSANTWFFKKDLAAFGSMADLGIHKIDLVRYLIGGRVSSIYARLATLDKKFPNGKPIEVDDNAVVMMTFDQGCMGTVTTSWTHYGQEANATVLYCEKGIARLYANPEYSLEIIYADGVSAHYKLDAMQTNDDAQQASSGVIDTFIEGIQTGKPTALDADAVIDSMKVVFACLESAETGKEVHI